MDEQALNSDGQPLGFCTDCNRVRWLGVVDGAPIIRDGSTGMPYGTCTQCVREAEEGS